MEGRDVIGLAETGSGKTAAFVLPVLSKVEAGSRMGALILCPTREIALQTTELLDTLSAASGRRTACLIGGVKIGPQIQRLKKGSEVVVATPGRLLDHLERRTLRALAVRFLVVDEADHMLDLGFLPQIRAVLDQLPKDRQTMMFSATLPAEIERLSKRLLEQDPVLVDLRPAGSAATGITHQLFLLEPETRKKCLMSLVDAEEGSVLVFMRRKMDADWACRQLDLAGHPVTRIHSDLSQRRRTEALQGFRLGEHRVLVATDIAARGLDIPRIEHIINFDIPETVEDYVHRAGRTARGAAQGTVSTLATWRDKAMVRAIEATLGTELERCSLPGVEAYEERSGTLRGRKRLRRRLL
jgi:ATP-dependent RNA helicase RhlE